MFLEMFGIVEHTDREKQAPHLHSNQLRNKLKKKNFNDAMLQAQSEPHDGEILGLYLGIV